MLELLSSLSRGLLGRVIDVVTSTTLADRALVREADDRHGGLLHGDRIGQSSDVDVDAIVRKLLREINDRRQVAIANLFSLGLGKLSLLAIGSADFLANFLALFRRDELQHVGRGDEEGLAVNLHRHREDALLDIMKFHVHVSDRRSCGIGDVGSGSFSDIGVAFTFAKSENGLVVVDGILGLTHCVILRE